MSDTENAMEPVAYQKTVFAGIWRRFAAFLVDGAILALPAFAVGFLFFDWACGLGQWGRLFGFFFALFYFGYFDSCRGNGQTPGKRFFKIKVIRQNGELLSIPAAIVRFVIIGIPYFLNGVSIVVAYTWQQNLLGVLFSVLIFGLGCSLIYLFFFNRGTHQSLQDIIVGTFVVRAESEGSLISFRVRKLHLVVVSCICIVVLLHSVSLIIRNSQSGNLAQQKLPLFALQHAIQTGLDVQRVGVFSGTTRIWSIKDGASTQSYLAITVQANELKGSESDFIKKIASIVIAKSPDLLGKPILSIQVQHGFDLGVARWSQASHESHDKATWLSKLSPNSTSTDGI